SYSRREAVRERLAETLNERLGVDGPVVIGDCGVVGYRTRARVLDALCLNDRETARPGIRDDPARRAESLLARDPDAVVIHSLSPDRLVPRPESGIFRALVENEALWRRYALSRVIPGVGDGFSYFVFERGPTAEASP
ncbi:MAG TPA: hypothetical protein VLA66_09155, partial [Thermoanaerobaculia bacterium]|nr:hypothetical protein [Thermoanaerobaculia bacterium]